MSSTKIKTKMFNQQPSRQTNATNVRTTTNNGHQVSDINYKKQIQSYREHGIIEKLLTSYGFIQCRDRRMRLFFHYSELKSSLDTINIGDIVEFSESKDRKTGKPVAVAITKLPSTPIEIVAEKAVKGTVLVVARSNKNFGSNGECPDLLDGMGRVSYEQEGETFFLPFAVEDTNPLEQIQAGDQIYFYISTDERNGNLRARKVSKQKPTKNVISDEEDKSTQNIQPINTSSSSRNNSYTSAAAAAASNSNNHPTISDKIFCNQSFESSKNVTDKNVKSDASRKAETFDSIGTTNQQNKGLIEGQQNKPPTEGNKLLKMDNLDYRLCDGAGDNQENYKHIFFKDNSFKQRSNHIPPACQYAGNYFNDTETQSLDDGIIRRNYSNQNFGQKGNLCAEPNRYSLQETEFYNFKNGDALLPRNESLGQLSNHSSQCSEKFNKNKDAYYRQSSMIEVHPCIETVGKQGIERANSLANQYMDVPGNLRYSSIDESYIDVNKNGNSSESSYNNGDYNKDDSRIHGKEGSRNHGNQVVLLGCQGIVCSVKEKYGFIERGDVVREIFFHFSEIVGNEEINLGDDVQFDVYLRKKKKVPTATLR